MTQRRLRVTHVIASPEGLGGAEQAALAIVRAGAARRDDVTVLYPVATPAGARAGAALYAPARFSACLASSTHTLPRALLWLQARLRRNTPDIVHAHLPLAALLVVLAGRGAGWRVYSVQHGDHFVMTGARLRERIDRAVGARFDRVVGCSQSVADFLSYRYQYPADRVTYIRNGWSGAPLPRDTEQDGPRIICTARLRSQKDHVTLLRALAGVVRSVPSAALDLVGDGPERGNIEQEARRLGVIDRITFHGDTPDVWPLLARASVFALTSTYEPLGIAALEAMAAALPVVASDVGGLREIVRHEETGLLVRPGDHKRFADALVALLTDRERAAGLGAAGARAARLHRAEDMAAAYLRLYDELALRQAQSVSTIDPR